MITMIAKHRYSVAAVFALAAHVLTLVSALGQEKAKPLVTLDLTITDEDRNPIPGATAEVMKWTGSYKSTNAITAMKSNGQASLQFPYSEDYFYLKIQAAGYATSVRELPQVSSGSEETLEIRLSRPVESWVEVTADGKPLAGAEVSVLKFVDVNGFAVHLTFKTGPQIGLKMATSDESGKLLLPELPKGAKVSFTISHPEWQSHKFEDLIATKGKLGSAELQTGVPIVIRLACNDEAALETLEGKLADVIMLPKSGGSNHATTLRHAFPIHNGQVRMTAHAVEYSELRFTLDDYFTFPMLMNYAYSPNSDLQLTGAEKADFELQIFRKQKARGRIVDHNGNGLEGAYVSASVLLPKEADAPPNEKKPGAEGPQSKNPIFDFIDKSISAGSATTDGDGYYEVDVTPGKVQFEVIHAGVFSSPLVTKYNWSGDLEDQLPEKVMLPIPELKGVVVDQDGKPVIGSIVTLRHYGRGDSDPVGTSSADGSFTLNMQRIPYSYSDTELETDVYVLAMDPTSGRAGIQKVDLTDGSATQEIKVEINEQSAEWPLNALGSPPVAAQEITKSFDQQIGELREKFALGTEGKIPPSMSGGTWLNTDAKSLQDFRGKFVLLDFWFIGCGPCIRDLPSVKIAHQEFSKHGFTVVSVNVTGQSVQDVQKFALDNGMNYPIVVDDVDNSILDAYKKLGVIGFPSYMLLDPDGRILHNDQLTSGKSLRQNKLELIYQAVRGRHRN